MKKTVVIDARLLRRAKAVSGARTNTETVRQAPEALVRHAAHAGLAALKGSEPNAKPVPRRRPRARRFAVRPRDFEFKPSVDLDRLNQVVDQMDVKAAAKTLKR